MISALSPQGVPAQPSSVAKCSSVYKCLLEEFKDERGHCKVEHSEMKSGKQWSLIWASKYREHLYKKIILVWATIGTKSGVCGNYRGQKQ